MTLQAGGGEFEFGWAEYHNQTTVHPLGLTTLLVLSLLLLTLPRRFALVAGLVLVCFIPYAQRVVFAGLDFTFLRIFVYVGMLRVLVRGEFQQMQWQRADSLMLGWAAVTSLAYFLLRGDQSAAVHIAGQVTEALASYFLVRCLVRNWGDFKVFALAIGVVGAVVSFSFLNEKATGRNAFSIFGGVPEVTPIRRGRLRCQGAFSHPILAGCFWAACVPYVSVMIFSRSGMSRCVAAVGTFACLVIIVTCASSTPIASLAAGAGAACWFACRHYSRLLRYAALGTTVMLHLVMVRPVWHLIGRVDFAGGSTGFHRYRLIDGAVNHFFEWALLGTASTAHWGWGLSDVTNEYIWAGVRGGFLALLLFLALIVEGFGGVGRLWRAAGGNRERQLLAWALGVSLFIHCISFVGVSYFGQINFLWYFSIAVIVSLSESAPRVAQSSRVSGRPQRGSVRNPAVSA